MALDIGPESRADRTSFTEDADLEAILDALSRAQAERVRVDQQIQWLEGLLIRRSRQVAEGTCLAGPAHPA